MSGVIETIQVKETTRYTKFGVKMSDGAWYSCFLDDKDNKEKMSKFFEGDEVSIEYATKGEFNNIISMKLVKSSADGNKVPKTAGAAAQGGSTTSPSQYNPALKDFRITYLAATKTSIDFVTACISQGLVSLGAKKNLQVDNYFNLVNEYAQKFAMVAWKAEVKEITKDKNKEEESAYSE